mgnify:CR=1 FL=1
MKVHGVILPSQRLPLLLHKRGNHNIDKRFDIFVAIILLLLTAAVAYSFVRVIPAGNVAVVEVFGKMQNYKLEAGLRLVNPFAKVILFNISPKEARETVEIRSSEGLPVVFNAVIVYRIEQDQIENIYKAVGREYEKKLLMSHLQSVCKRLNEFCGTFRASELYTQGREMLAQKLEEGLKKVMEENGIIVEKVILEDYKYY